MINKIKRAKIKLQEQFPFFGRLSLSMRFIEDKDKLFTNKGPFATLKDNTVYYDSEYLKSLDINEIMGYIAHEIMHVILKHFERLDDRNKFIFNIACDIVVNNILELNGFVLHNEMLKTCDDRFVFEGIDIKNISKKSAEQVYNELIKDSIDINVPDHIYTDSMIGFDTELEDSATFAKDRGKEPYGIRLYDRIDWSGLLRKYFNSNIVSDYSFKNPKRLNGVILPGKIKDKTNILVHIDTSASIDEGNLLSFYNELKRISKLKNVDIDVIFCNDKIQGVHSLKNNISFEYKVGGLTSHKPIVKFINSKNKYNYVISMTDGYSDIENCFNDIKGRVKKLILLNNEDKEQDLKKYAKIIVMR